MVKLATTMNVKGPFFEHDPAKTFRQNIRVMLAAVAAEGRSDVIAQLEQGQAGRLPIGSGVEPERVSGHVVGRVASLGGKPWKVTAVVSVNNSGFTPKQGIALMAAGSVVERRTGAFKRTTGRIRRSKHVNVDELLKGIA